jgi:cation transport regulator ChaC
VPALVPFFRQNFRVLEYSCLLLPDKSGDYDMTDYIFGYGSLLERASRTRTNPDAVGAWPARVTGYSRGWYHRFAAYVGSTCTFLGAVQDDGKTMNGVIYKVADIESTKKREKGYTAIPLISHEIEMLDGGGTFEVGKGVNAYIFISNPESFSKTKAPTADCPMVQSYVDICINGCLEIDQALKEGNVLHYMQLHDLK